MKLRWKDNNTKSIGVAFVSDEDAKILNAVGYFYCEDEDVSDEDMELVEVWKPNDQLYSDKIGKWIAFKQEGMEPVLHGQVKGVNGTCMKVKCKNACLRFASLKDCYKFFDEKRECYDFK